MFNCYNGVGPYSTGYVNEFVAPSYSTTIIDESYCVPSAATVVSESVYLPSAGYTTYGTGYVAPGYSTGYFPSTNYYGL